MKAAPMENCLRVLVSLRILIRDTKLQKLFIEQDGVALITQVLCYTYLININIYVILCIWKCSQVLWRLLLLLSDSQNP